MESRTYRRYRELAAADAIPAGAAWGEYPEDPYRGALNRITPDAICAASRCIKDGKTFSLNWELTHPSPPLFHRKNHRHVFFDDPNSTDDYLDGFYLQGSSHWDALCHVHHPVLGHYGGLKKIKSPENNPIGVDQYARQGIVGRGVLVDIAQHLAQAGRPLNPISGDRISVADFRAALQAQGTTLRLGDILLFRTGWIHHWRHLPAFRHEIVQKTLIPGLGGAAEFAEFLWDSGVAALACDNPTVEVFPFESDTDNLHHRLVVKLGMPLGEMFDLDELAAACHADRRYEFFFSAAPLNLPGGAGSPANALAIR
ncbi:MAG TPA: cyclase family protein [Verrucomicrobiae bacterium]|jgi:kynurenine formamidase|nr:cyclase family protein [Verrucomicrobiae bacterium]